MMRRTLITQLTFFLILAIGLAGSLSAATWKVGLAKAKITPTESIWLAGYGARKHPAEGTLHDLWIKVVALEDAAGQKAVLVGTDLLGIPPNVHDRLAEAIERRCGLDRAHVMLNTSHTHSGPVLDGVLFDCYPLDDQQKRLIKEYTGTLEKTIVDAVARALADMTPALLSAGEGITTFAVNRRNNNRPRINELRAKGQIRGPFDHDVPVLTIRAPEGELRAIVFGYACHPTTIGINKWSGDYPGFAQIELEKRFPGVHTQFFQGCGADQNPMPRHTVELCKKYGKMLAEAVDLIVAAPMRPVQPTLRAEFEFASLKFEALPSREKLEKYAGNVHHRLLWIRRIFADLDAGKKLQTECRLPVQVWRLGADQLLIGLGGEVTVDYSLIFKKAFGPTTWIAGYTNEVPSYIPSERVRREGGYDAGAFDVYGLPALRWAPGIEKNITDSVARLVEKTK